MENPAGKQPAGNLAEYGDSLAKSCDKALKWVRRNSDIVRNEQESLLKDLRHARRALRNCARAARTRMSAGVFGPSQAGKSYLISALARGENNELTARFGKETHDFLSEINPEGGKESTGLVTRFTLYEPEGMPEDYPVHLRLLSETDLVRIIANAYFADFEHKTDPESDIAATLASLKKMPKAAASPVDLDDLEELREYLKAEFGSKTRARDLERDYWEEALRLGPQLDLEGRIRLYALIWDEVEEFTSLLRKLLQTLENLGHPQELFCKMTALTPREESIIDVATLSGLDGDGGSLLETAAPSGKKAAIPRAIVAALTAELTIVMKDRPAEYFEHTDLLDFPGYRSRYKLTDVRAETAKPGMLRELFLRGKVAYLFQRYSNMRELNSMLLCIGPSNQEVQDLPGVINAWIGSTHGKTPEEREGKLVSLLFVLTKFDMEFEDKKGAQALGNRWDNRLKASLLNFFGQGYDWPRSWTPQHGFDNLFLLRNPNFKFDAVLSYDGDRETGIRPERQNFVQELQNSFLNSKLVGAHFRNPAKAWDEAMRLNDGGISHIRESLNPLCNPDIKRQQLLRSMEESKAAVLRRLEPFYKTDDREEMRKQKVQLVSTLFSSLGAVEMQQHRLGQLLRDMLVSDSDIYDLYPEAVRRYREQGEENENSETGAEAPALANVDLAEINLADLNPFSATPQTQPAQKEKEPMRDEEAFYASYIESKWVEKLHNLADDPNAQKYYMLDAKTFGALANELATGSARLGFADTLADAFRKSAAYANTRKESIINRQAALAARTINDYMDYLGFHPHSQPDRERTVNLGGDRPVVVFSPQKKPAGLPKLDESRQPWAQNWFRDWLNALAGLVMDNVNFDGEQVVNVVENAALGAIIDSLKRQPANAANG